MLVRTIPPPDTATHIRQHASILAEPHAPVALPRQLTHCVLEVGAEQQLLQVLMQPSQPPLLLQKVRGSSAQKA